MQQELHCRRQIRSTSGAQSDLIGVPEPMSVEAVLAAHNGGYSRYVCGYTL
jgi:hypothetical protein